MGGCRLSIKQLNKNKYMQKKLIAVAAAVAMFATATPAFAAVNSTKINISTINRGSITNVTTADSHTGLNLALGSAGGSGGTGGNVTSAGSENNGGALAGNGGNGGAGGPGGLVDTGNASAEAGTANDLNHTDAEVALDCDCGDINSVTIDVVTDNDRVAPTQNNIDNFTDARSRSGENLALGSLGGNGGVGGVVDGGVGSENNGGAHAGTGGAGGAGGVGATIRTGSASSTSGTINMLNTRLLRVRL